jgi:hypothetical protein
MLIMLPEFLFYGQIFHVWVVLNNGRAIMRLHYSTRYLISRTEEGDQRKRRGVNGSQSKFLEIT